jgi:hypothetical protein
MLTLAILITLALGVSAMTANFRRRAVILSPQPPEPSPALASVLTMALAAVVLLLLAALRDPHGLVLLLLPLFILLEYIATLVLIIWIQPEWRKSTLFLWAGFAPLFGGILAFWILFAERRKP